MIEGFRIALILTVPLFSLTACQSADQTGPTGHARTTPALTKTDVTFINTVSVSGPEEVRFAQLAGTQATDAAMRHFAEGMVADLTMVDQQVAVLANSNGMTPASDMDGRHQALYQQLQSMHGAAFDRGYINGQLQDLTMLIQNFQAEADSGSEPEVRSVARQNLPILQQRLREAATLAGL